MTFDHTGPDEGLQYIRNAYKVPAHLGTIVSVDGHRGRITGHDSARLLLVDVVTGEEFSAHPTWKTTYHVPEVSA